MRATVVVVTYNHCSIISECLHAVKATIGGADEVIVVDNASADGTVEVIRRDHPWVRVIRSATNLGYGGASNLGAHAAGGEHLVFLNPDAVPTAGWLDALVRPLREKDVGVSTAKLLLTGAPARIDAFGNNLHLSGIPTCRGWGQPEAAYTTQSDVAAVSGACFAINRELFEHLTGFDERMFLYYEDDDLSLRARLAGYRCVAVPHSVVLHDHRAGFSPEKLRYLERNRLWSLLKVLSVHTLFALAPVLLAGSCLAWGMAVRGGASHVVSLARAYVELAAWLPQLGLARREVQALRAVSDAQLLALHDARLPVAQISSGALAEFGERLLTHLFRGGRRLASVLGVR